MNNPIGIKITRAMARNRKIILVVEPDLLSNEVFAVTPFYEEGDEKNQLRETKITINITEKGGDVSAKASYYGDHYTKGHRQIFGPELHHRFIDKKDCALNWVETESEEHLSEDRINKVLSMWDHDKQFQYELKVSIKGRKLFFAEESLLKAKREHQEATEKLHEAIDVVRNSA